MFTEHAAIIRSISEIAVQSRYFKLNFYNLKLSHLQNQKPSLGEKHRIQWLKGKKDKTIVNKTLHRKLTFVQHEPL
jgi:hypothetical protein